MFSKSRRIPDSGNCHFAMRQNAAVFCDKMLRYASRWHVKEGGGPGENVSQVVVNKEIEISIKRLAWGVQLAGETIGRS